MRRLRKSITARFIAAVFAVLLTGQIFGAIVLILNARSSLFDSLAVRIQRTSSFAAGVCSGPLVNYDYALIDSYLEEIIKDEEIVSVHLLDNTGAVLREKRKAEIRQGGINPFYIRTLQSTKTPVVAAGEKVGEIVIDYSAFKINRDIAKNMIVISLYQFGLLVLVSIIMMSLFRKSITNPVSSITRAIEQITSGNLTTPVPDAGEDEIGEIARGISFLETRLSSVIEKINATAVNVSMTTKQVDQAYHHVAEGIMTQAETVKQVHGSIHKATRSQEKISESTENLSGFSDENLSSLLEVKITSEEIAKNIQRLFQAAENSYSVVIEMNQAAKAIAESAGKVSSAVEDTSASVEEVGASVREVEEHARESSGLAEKVKGITAGIGMMSVVNAMEGMKNISDEVKKSAEIIKRLGVRSADIEKILSVIKEVTEQTNLLSLNAAILAAQAGEYGKSFSVVADEIRGLSERTSVSTREIGGIIKTIQQDIRDAVHSIDAAQEKTEDGNALVLKVGEALREILNASVLSTEMTKAIERATEEQSLGLKQIGSAIEDIRKMIGSVEKSTKEQTSALSYLLDGTGEVKEVAELSSRGAQEQAEGIKMISRNLELASERVKLINEAVLSQKMLNSGMIEAMDRIGNTGVSTVRDMEDVSQSLKTLVREIETLRQDMQHFTIT